MGPLNLPEGNVITPPPYPGSKPKTPWGTNSTDPTTKVVDPSFFTALPIDGERWNKLYPYRLLVVQETGPDTYEIVGQGNALIGEANSLLTRQGSASVGRYQVEFQEISSKWEYRLPITPQQLAISTVFTTDTSATLRGIVEQHGGVRFKMISMNGTFGVLPFRDNLKDISPPNPWLNNANALFGGTIESAQNAVNSAIGVFNTLGSGYPVAPPEVKQIDNLSKTGYAQALLMDQFLEQYAEAKRNPNNSTWRLALDIPKQNQTFLVSPVQFAYSQSVDSPNEYRFQLQLKAWKRIKIDYAGGPAQFTGINLTTPIIKKALNALNQLQTTVYALYSVISSVRSDILTLDNAIKSTSVLLKSIAGLGTAVSDLPKALLEDYHSALADFVANQNTQLGQKFRKPYLFKGIAQQKDKMNQGVDFATLNAHMAPSGVANPSVTAITSAVVTHPLVNLSQAYSGLNYSNFTNPASADKLPPISSASDLMEVYQTINVSDLNLNSAQRKALQDYQDSISLLTVDDLMQNLKVIQDVEFKLSNLFAGGDPEYNQIYGKPAPSTRSYPMTDDEYAILQTFYEAEQSLLAITATNQLNSTNITDTYTYVQNLAQASNIPFDSASSKVRYPVPFGLTIEQISSRYLGDPNRWNELATLNNLAEPYIDETGFYYSLLTNPLGRDLNVSQVDNLYIGQLIAVMATGQFTLHSKITKIEKFADNNYSFTIADTLNLTAYTTTAGAKIHAYLPATVNSQNFIWVPSVGTVSDTLVTRPIPSTQNDALTTLSKIDLLLTDQMDIAIDQFGNFKLAYGMSNLLQALKLKLSTPIGSLIEHPTYGSPISVGTSFADIQSGQVYQDVLASIQGDARFDGLQKLSIQIQPPSMKIGLSARIANGLGIFPLTFNLS